MPKTITFRNSRYAAKSAVAILTNVIKWGNVKGVVNIPKETSLNPYNEEEYKLIEQIQKKIWDNEKTNTPWFYILYDKHD